MIFHGSIEIVKNPEYGKGKKENDYGLGFYCTEDLELAKEWACSDIRGGFVNTYEIDTSSLSIVDLSLPQYSFLDWLTVLVNNRIFTITSPIAEEAKAYLTEYFHPDLSSADIITGYRADDSYFSFALDFLNNVISLRQLSRAMRLGNLGEQFVLKSKKAFNLINFINSEAVVGDMYFPKRKKRDSDARDEYLNKERNKPFLNGDIFMIDILRGEIKPHDERLQRDIFE